MDVGVVTELEKNKEDKEIGGNRNESTGNELKWYGHLMRREEHSLGGKATEIKVQGRRKS